MFVIFKDYYLIDPVSFGMQDPVVVSLKVVGESKSLVENRTTPSSNVASRPLVMVGSIYVQLPNIVVKEEKADVVQVVPEMDFGLMVEYVKPDIWIADLFADEEFGPLSLDVEKPKIKEMHRTIWYADNHLRFKFCS